MNYDEESPDDFLERVRRRHEAQNQPSSKEVSSIGSAVDGALEQARAGKVHRLKGSEQAEAERAARRGEKVKGEGKPFRPSFAKVPWSLIIDQDLNLGAKIVYAFLAGHCLKSSQCWPSLRAIAVGIGVHSSTVSRALDDLESSGWIVRSREGRRNIYTLVE